ncbi:MAG: type IV-A pilus assembly ATPase PilB [Methylotenera sp.]|nr:type IV-A pilus assembly ATPase PilB [Oligoflexia bacterium]
MSRQLAELLVRDRIISPDQFAQAMEAAKSGATSAVHYLIEKKIVAEAKLLQHLTKKYNLHSINLARFEIAPEVIKLMNAETVKKIQAIPIQSKNGTLIVAVCDPTVIPMLDDLKFKLKQNIEPVLTLYSAFDAAIAKNYSGFANVSVAIAKMTKEQQKEREKDDASPSEMVIVHDIESPTTPQDAPVITIVNGILSEGIKRGASDIHVEPYEKRFRVRMRVDGILHEIVEIPLEMKRAVIARFKIMSKMDISESRIPQDGRIKLKASGKEIDFRVNSLPTLFGEKVVLRMLSKGNLQLDLAKLGFEPQQLEVFKKGIYMPNGMVLVTGPTGSGKTTTLYSALSELNQITDNISTAEDPVEYNLEGVNQVQIHKEIGLTFANVLRALLRQDPDTVLVGEIRDFETAEVAVQAALTGHLVLSTLHTNDAPSTITRLMNMGLEPFLVVASLNTIVAQRLLRTICAKCKVEVTVPKPRLIECGFSEAVVANIKLYEGKGCSACNNSGYKGRVAIYEVLDFSNALKEMVLKGESVMDIRKQAIKEGMQSLRSSALNKVGEGRTTLAEALTSTTEN